ncbi:MAG: 4-alpha-glucanotransferase [Pseudomonadota bacterium]
MTSDEALIELGQRCGILPSYFDLQGQEHHTSQATYKALIEAEGLDVSSEVAIARALEELRLEQDDRWFPAEINIICDQETALEFGLGASWQLRNLDDNQLVAEGSPADHIVLPPLATGYYRLRAETPERVESIRVLCAPAHLPLLSERTGVERIWGMSAALYGMRSARNTGFGDYSDLAALGQVAASHGAGFVGVNPVHEMGFHNVDAFSPYSPSHRGFLNTHHIALDDLPGGFRNSQAGYGDIRDREQLDPLAHRAVHNKELKAAYAQFTRQASAADRSGFASFCAAGGQHLDRFAQYEALSARHGGSWQSWPDHGLETDLEDLEFYKWLQWVAESQLARAQRRLTAAGMVLGLYLDLAVGPRRDGAEAWCEADSVAQGVSIGAPPDQLSPAGQNWSLSAFSPRKLKQADYQPLRRVLAATMRHAGIIRIDHVLGLNRSFWLPDNGAPGGYITQPFASLLSVVKIEAERHGTIVIGEDLGLVPDGFRDQMRAAGFYGYSVLQYERRPDGQFPDPSALPEQSLACFATHDTPTLKGYEIGRDIDWWAQVGWIDHEAIEPARQERAADVAALGQLSPAAEDSTGDLDPFEASVITALARGAPSLVCIQLDDICGQTEAQNLPGTIDAHPNWRRRYDIAIEELGKCSRLSSIGTVMARHGRGSVSKA